MRNLSGAFSGGAPVERRPGSAAGMPLPGPQKPVQGHPGLGRYFGAPDDGCEKWPPCAIGRPRTKLTPEQG
jgi:hypothetical protein